MKRRTAQEVGDALVRSGSTAVRSLIDPDEVAFVGPPEPRPATMKNWKVLQANRRWVSGCTITECVRIEPETTQSYRRFTATIRGWENFKIWEGFIDRPCDEIVSEVKLFVTAIRDRIDNGDESDFYRKNKPANA